MVLESFARQLPRGLPGNKANSSAEILDQLRHLIGNKGNIVND
jgi:hypothetical protein